MPRNKQIQFNAFAMFRCSEISWSKMCTLDSYRSYEKFVDEVLMKLPKKNFINYPTIDISFSMPFQYTHYISWWFSLEIKSFGGISMYFMNVNTKTIDFLTTTTYLHLINLKHSSFFSWYVQKSAFEATLFDIIFVKVFLLNSN